MKKALTLILALIMVMSLLVGCNNDPATGDKESSKPNNDQQSSGSGNNDGTTPDESETESEKIDYGIPDDLNYNDATIEVLGWNSVFPEWGVDADSMNGDPVADAVYRRNLYTEELLGVKLNFTILEGRSGGESKYSAALKNRASDPSTPIDIVSAYSRCSAYVALEGMFQDLTQLENIDMTKEWWPQYLRDELSIDNRLYFTTGDVSTSVMYMMYGVFYNNTLLEERGLENPVKLVDNDEWTLDKLITMSTGVYEDIDGTEGISDGDFFGFGGLYYDLDPVFHGAGYHIAVPSDEEGEYIKWSDEYFSELVEQFLTKTQAWLKDDSSAFRMSSDISITAFSEGRLLFRIGGSSHGDYYRDTDIAYGIVPMPKLDPSKQENFVTCLGNAYSLWSVSSHTHDSERAAAVMQVMGYYGKEIITPAVFDVTLKGKWSKNDDMLRMWDIMRETISIDLGRIYFSQLGKAPDVISKAMMNGTNWSTLTSPLQISTKQKMVDKLNIQIKALING